MKFNLGDKVKVTVNTNGRTLSGKEGKGIVTAIYDSKHTPSQYSKADYRIRNEYGETFYSLDKYTFETKTIKGFCYKNTRTGEFLWLDSEDSKASIGGQRYPSLDFCKDIEY